MIICESVQEYINFPVCMAQVIIKGPFTNYVIGIWGGGGQSKYYRELMGGRGGSPQKIMNYAIFLSKCSSFCLSRIFSL